MPEFPIQGVCRCWYILGFADADPKFFEEARVSNRQSDSYIHQRTTAYLRSETTFGLARTIILRIDTMLSVLFVAPLPCHVISSKELVISS